jgi:hypothetical protein
LLKTVQIAKGFIGVTLLSALIYWLSQQGSGFPEISVTFFAATTLASLFVIWWNSEILRLSVRSLGCEMVRQDSLWLTTIGALGNAMGGLPLGTGVKFALLIGKFRLSPSAVFWTYFFYSIMNAVVLMMFGSVFAWLAGLPHALSIIFVLPAILFWTFCASARRHAGLRGALPGPLAALVTSPLLRKAIAISHLNVLTMVLCFSLILRGSAATSSSMLTSLTAVSLALPAGILTGLPSMGGIQELLLGFSGKLLEMPMEAGVRLALIARAAALIAAALMLLALLVSRRAKSGA